jgi:hypothetical protein
MNTGFFPNGYTLPSSNNARYMKFKQGENRFRFLSKPIVAWEDWVNNKPYRYRECDKPPRPSNPAFPLKYCFIAIVWNDKSEQIEILNINQRTIQSAIYSLWSDRDWGDPSEYDIKVTRTGELKNTDYHVSPAPKQPVLPSIIAMFHESPIYLDALYDGGDPFAKQPDGRVTPCIFPKGGHDVPRN